GGTVLQRSTGFFGQGSIAGSADAVHVEHGAVRKAARKADDAGLAQQLEEFADGGGFYIVQAVGKLHGVDGVGCNKHSIVANWQAGFLRPPDKIPATKGRRPPQSPVRNMPMSLSLYL